MPEPQGPHDDPDATVSDLESGGSAFGAGESRVAEALRQPLPRWLGAGRFEVLGLLGEGGMGEVFRARDVRLDREVALKRLKPQALDEHARARLAREAQAMALLSHPNVIEVYDIELDDGLVLVMELVGGATLSQWMQAGPRAWREALPIFVQAGRGLAAAHDAGLVHRDFKPSNVILGDDGRVRVMDFGLARPPGHSVDESRAAEAFTGSGSMPSSSTSLPRDEALTATGMVVGTPAYMAPEQVQGQPADGRADQYAFCVVLWQALCGKRPFDGTYVELGRAKLRGPPAWPPDVPAPRRLVAAIRRGLAPDPGARWASMPRLLVELDAVGRTLPARRRLHLGVGGLVAIGAAAGVVIAWPTGESGCDDAETLYRASWTDERRGAVEAAILGTEAAHAAETWARVDGTLDAYAREWARARNAACEASRGASPAASSSEPDPLLDARLRCLQGRQQRFEALVGTLAQADEATTTEASAAVERLASLAACDDPEHLRIELPPPDDPMVAERVSVVREGLARADAQRRVMRCSDAMAELTALAPEVEALAHGPLTAELRLAEGNAADCAGDYAAAERALRDAYFTASELGHGEVATQAALALMTVVGVDLERHDEGKQWSEHAAVGLARTGEPAIEVEWLERLGDLQHAAGRYDEAVASFERALAGLPAVSERETAMHAVVLGNLGSTLAVLGRLDEARERVEQALAIVERVRGPDHPEVTGHMVNLATIHTDLGELAKAEALQRRALARVERELGPTHPSVLHVVGNLALSLSLQGRASEALALHERCVAGLEAVFGPEHPHVAMALNNLGIDQLGTGDVRGAIRSHRRALEIREATLGPAHMLTASSLSNLADAELAAGDAQAARRGYARALPMIEATLGPDAVPVSYPLMGMGRALVAEGDPSAAIPLLERGLRLRERGGIPPELFEARFELARVLWDTGRDRARALALAREALAVEAIGDPEREHVTAWLRERAQ